MECEGTSCQVTVLVIACIDYVGLLKGLLNHNCIGMKLQCPSWITVLQCFSNKMTHVSVFIGKKSMCLFVHILQLLFVHFTRYRNPCLSACKDEVGTLWP